MDRVFVDAVQKMRNAQRDWFGGDKSKEKLLEAKRLERLVDTMLAERLDSVPTFADMLAANQLLASYIRHLQGLLGRSPDAGVVCFSSKLANELVANG